MLRSLLILSLCTFFLACSSEDDSAALHEWFSDQSLATSYGKQFEEIEILVKNFTLGGFDSSAYMVSSYAALGNVNGMEHLLYFGLEILGSPSDTLKDLDSRSDTLKKDLDSLKTLDSLSHSDSIKIETLKKDINSLSDKIKTIKNIKLRIDNTFYTDIPGASRPERLEATIYWLKESEFQHDSLPKAFKDTANVNIEREADAFFVSLPEELLKKPQPPDTLLLVGLKLRSDNTVLRIAPPSTSDIRGLLYVAQKTNKSDDCLTCLHAGVRESLLVTFEIKDKEMMAGKTAVFAQLVLPKQSGTTGSELGIPVPIYVYGYVYGPKGLEDYLEDYRVDTAYVNHYKRHPNLVFSGGDSLMLQVTRSLRNYAIVKDSPDTLNLTLRLGVPMLDTTSLYFYNSIYLSKKVFSDRPAYARYDFGSAFEAGKTAKLKLWFAD